VNEGSVREYELDPQELGVPRCDVDELRGGDAAHNAKALRAVLNGGDGGHRSAVVLNAAGAIAASGHARDLREGIAVALETIDSGAAGGRLEELVAFSRESEVPA
jgi:anthranilate phosphoribosyltransferase